MGQPPLGRLDQTAQLGNFLFLVHLKQLLMYALSAEAAVVLDKLTRSLTLAQVDNLVGTMAAYAQMVGLQRREDIRLAAGLVAGLEAQ